jgi:hypothetical protein
VNLIDEEDIAVVEIGQDRSDVAGAFEGWSRGDPQPRSQLVGQNACHRRLAKAGRAG